MLTDSPVVRSTGPRVLFFGGAIVTVAILLWMHQLRLRGDLHGLATIFFVLFAYEDYNAAVFELLILMVAVFIASYLPARRILRLSGEHPLVIAFASAIVLGAGALFVYHNHPLSMDEYAAYFQSRVFAAGHLSGQFPPALMDWLIPPGFQDFFLNVSHATGRVASNYWPANALLLAPFTLVGIPWAYNPIVSALTLLVIHRLALQLFKDVEAAGFALLLTVASPVFFGNGISYYSMPSHLLANSLYALLLIKPTLPKAALAGVVGSIALSLHNPVPHMLFALPWLVWIGTRRGGPGLLAALCAGYLPLCLLLGIGWFEFSNQLMHGAAVAAAETATAEDRFRGLLGMFGLPTPTVLLARAIGAAKVWVWAVPGLLILACVGAASWGRNMPCRLLAASAVTTFVGYLFFPADQGHGWGYRYFHSAWMALPLLATAAIFRPEGTNSEPDHTDRPGFFEDPETLSYITACIALTLIFGNAWRAWEMQSFIAGDLSQLPHYAGQEHRIVIIDGTFSFYGGDLVQNDPWLRGDVIRMYSHGSAADAAMMARYYPELHRVYADRYGTVWSAAASRGYRQHGTGIGNE